MRGEEKVKDELRKAENEEDIKRLEKELHEIRLNLYGGGPYGIGYGPRHPLDMD